MAVLDIIRYPHPMLTTPSEPLSHIGEETLTLVANMIETMYAARGIGLAAPQVGYPFRLCVIDTEYSQSGQMRPLVMINPHIIKQSGSAVQEEGCLSLPGLYGEVNRATHIIAEFKDLDGLQPKRIEAQGRLAVCIQHEIDHLQGIMFIDRPHNRRALGNLP